MTFPVDLPWSTNATMSGCARTSAGSLRDALVDTNYLSYSRMAGAARPVHVKSRTVIVTRQTSDPSQPPADDSRAACFICFLNDLTFSSEVASTTSATDRKEPASA